MKAPEFTASGHLYRADKSAALQGRRRTPESTLHVIALLGGWPRAMVGQQVVPHKTTKQFFRTVFWVTVIADCVHSPGSWWARPAHELG